MNKGRDTRTAQCPVDDLFIDRWSPRAMSGESISPEELFSLFEAARWAPSSGNSQPWRMVYAHRDSASWPRFFDVLAEGNRLWCANAAVLVVVVSQTMREGTDKPLLTHSYDTGAAWASLALQGWMRGLAVRGMGGFDYAKAKASLGIPDGYRVEAMIAIGHRGAPEDLPESLRARETPTSRLPVSALVFEGEFGVTPT